ncbi:MAG TPA: hypothetical protein VN516_07220, partial [Candidatus Baltobacteraceae bacterium]|nr:hypothetical protein [Candidatus Baltobacteraceae bacterium]
MKKLSLILAALLMAIAAQAQSDLIARIHFLGGDKISADTNSAAFANEFNSPQAQALENQTLDKLAKIFVAKLKPNAGAEDLAQLRPLLDDLLKSEWILEIRGATNGVPEYTLAVRLSSERANLWSKNLHAPLENWVSMEVPQSATGVMWIKKFDPSYWCLFGRSSGYTIVDFGQGNLHEGILRFAESKFTDTGTNWLSADLNWPRLAQLFPALREFDFPKIAFQVIGHNGYFRFNGKLNLSQPLPSLEAWRVPTNSIHQPFISFTAARGVAPWLAKQSWFAPYKLSPQPNQFFTWSMPGIAFQTYAAEPVPNANAALTQLYENLSANGNWRSNFS